MYFTILFSSCGDKATITLADGYTMSIFLKREPQTQGNIFISAAMFKECDEYFF
jgi:hypothetical protein